MGTEGAKSDPWTYQCGKCGKISIYNIAKEAKYHFVPILAPKFKLFIGNLLSKLNQIFSAKIQKFPKNCERTLVLYNADLLSV